MTVTDSVWCTTDPEEFLVYRGPARLRNEDGVEVLPVSSSPRRA